METTNLTNFNFSVLMSVYKNENPEYFHQAVDSVINQTLKPNEIILIRDGLVPETLQNEIDYFINKYNNLFNYIPLEKNVGLGKALALGVEKANNELIARMDTDDICVNDRFEKQINLFKENLYLTITGSNILEFENKINDTNSLRTVCTTNEEIYNDIQQRCPFNHQTVMFKKQDILNVGNYIDWFYNEDYYLWIRLVEAKFIMSNLDEILVNVRVNKDLYSRRGGWKYFISEKDIQKYMYKKNMINYKTYIINVAKRFIVQILLPNSFRRIIFNKFARKGVKNE